MNRPIVRKMDKVTNDLDCKTELILVRHGQTWANIHKKLPPKEAKLTPQGKKQSFILARWLLNYKNSFTCFFTSPLTRAIHTARIIGMTFNKELAEIPGLVEIPELAEMDFGDATGLDLEQFEKHFDEHEWKFDDYTDMTFRWPNGESRKEFATRCQTTFDYCLPHHRGKSGLYVTHGGVIGFFLAAKIDGHLANWIDYMPHFGYIDTLQISADGKCSEWRRIKTDLHRK